MKRITLRAGTRNSPLARTQTQSVCDQIGRVHQSIEVEIVHVATKGDRSSSLSRLGSIGIFTKELDRALLKGEIDFAVHSLKDLPTRIDQSLVIAAIPERTDPRDALVSATAEEILDLAPCATVGTSSVRRRTQLLSLRSDLKIIDLRGNIDTRIRKVEQGELDAIIVAYAGLIRMSRREIARPISLDQILPAPGQGALSIVTRKDDFETQRFLSHLDHAETRIAVEAERLLLTALGGGCQLSLGVLAEVLDDTATMQAVIVSKDGQRSIRKGIEGNSAETAAIVEELASRLRADGAEEILFARG